MSIASEITRINGNIASAYTAASNKGATLPATQNSANLATCIASISGGGGGSVITATNTTGAAITAGDKVWITPNGAGYDIVTFQNIVNTMYTRDFTAVGNISVNDTTGIASNFSTSNYINVDKALGPSYFEFIINVCPAATEQASNYYNNILIETDQGNVIFFTGRNHRLAIHDGRWVESSIEVPLDKWGWVYFWCETSSTYPNGKTVSKYLADPQNIYTLDNLPSLSTWTSMFDADWSIFNNNKFQIGGSTQHYYGSLNLKNTIVRDGQGNVLWQPYVEAVPPDHNSFSGYAAENIASGSSGQVMIQASGA